MPKLTADFDLSEYAPVADRIAAFYERYPTGRIVTRMVSRDRDVVFKALVFRDANDTKPAATGWASEREGDGEVNAVACVENTETSAIGRALANLGFTASKKRASREEMLKVERARREPVQFRSTGDRDPGPPASTPLDHAPSVAAQDLSDLLASAECAGFPVERGEALRRLLADGSLNEEAIEQVEVAIRSWMRRVRH